MPPQAIAKPRVQTLSDMVFGLALSIGAVVLIAQRPTDAPSLYTGLLIFGFSFLILVTVWHNYATIMAVLPLETQRLVLLNMVLLFAVAVEPYLLYVVASPTPTPAVEPASVLYALDLAVMNGILGAFTHVVTREKRPLVAASEIRKMRDMRNLRLAMGVVFAVTALPIFWSWMLVPGFPARVILWILTLPIGWLVRLVHR